MNANNSEFDKIMHNWKQEDPESFNRATGLAPKVASGKVSFYRRILEACERRWEARRR